MFSRALLLCSLLALATTHQGATDEEQEQPAVDAGSGAATVLLQSTKKGARDKGGDGDRDAPAKGASQKDHNSVRITGYPLFIFAEGPLTPHAPVPAKTFSRTKRMIAEINRKIPGSRIQVVSPFTSEALAEVWRKARTEKKDDTSLITTSLLIIQARGSTGEGLTLMGENGPEPEAKWKAAIASLSESIYGNTGGKLETVILSGSAGALNCKNFPGFAFGASRDSEPLDEQGFDFWLKWQEEHRQDIFPTSARDWFDSWNITDKITRRHYFYCPTSSPRRYLGNKAQNDEIRGGW